MVTIKNDLLTSVSDDMGSNLVHDAEPCRTDRRKMVGFAFIYCLRHYIFSLKLDDKIRYDLLYCAIIL